MTPDQQADLSHRKARFEELTANIRLELASLERQSFTSLQAVPTIGMRKPDGSVEEFVTELEGACIPLNRTYGGNQARVDALKAQAEEIRKRCFDMGRKCP